MKYFVREASSTRKRWQVCYTVLSEDESYDYYNSMISKVIPVTKRGYNKTGIVYGSNSSSSS